MDRIKKFFRICSCLDMGRSDKESIVKNSFRFLDGLLEKIGVLFIRIGNIEKSR